MWRLYIICTYFVIVTDIYIFLISFTCSHSMIKWYSSSIRNVFLCKQKWQIRSCMGALSYIPVSTVARLWYGILKFVSAFLNLKMSKFDKYLSSSNTLSKWQYVLNLLELFVSECDFWVESPNTLWENINMKKSSSSTSCSVQTFQKPNW